MEQNSFFYKLRYGIKTFRKKDIVISISIFAVILYFIINYFITDNLTSSSVFNPQVSPTASVDANDTVHTELEERLSSTLQRIKGVGSVSVFITYSSDIQKSLAENGNSYYNNSAHDIPASSSHGNEVQSALIIAEGVDDIETRIKIQQAVQTALLLEAHQIRIFEMGK